MSTKTKVLLASNNKHKLSEFKVLLKETPLEIELSDSSFDVEETGETFYENALLKAKGFYEKFGTPSLSDDSGLCVEALPNDLGVYSKRFGDPSFDDEMRARHLLEKLEGEENRKAYFICVLCLYLSPDEHYFFEGRVEGEIATFYRGTEGFGYDPVFLPEKGESSKTLAEQALWKDKHSHRAAACRYLCEFLTTKNCQSP
ncbi:MAG: RdgB/HAM1 family non-canonical purine NTP pyrophosphatase [Bacteriovoracaceae bacterium]